MGLCEISVITIGVIFVTFIISYTVFRIKKLTVCAKYREHIAKLEDAKLYTKRCICCPHKKCEEKPCRK